MPISAIEALCGQIKDLASEDEIRSAETDINQALEMCDDFVVAMKRACSALAGNISKRKGDELRKVLSQQKRQRVETVHKQKVAQELAQAADAKAAAVPRMFLMNADACGLKGTQT